MFTNRTWTVPSAPAIHQSVELTHVDSNFCWCEPVVEVDERGQEVVVHRQVTWN